MTFTRAHTAACCLMAAALLMGGGLFRHGGVSISTPATAAGPADPAKPAPDKQKVIRALIDQLGDEAFPKREAAEKRLVAIGEPALELLLVAIKESSALEVRRRARRAFQAIPRSPMEEVRSFVGGLAWDGSLSELHGVAVTPDGLKAVTAGYNGLRSWDLQTGKSLLAFGEKGWSHLALGLSADGKRLITIIGPHEVRVYDLKSRDPLHVLFDGWDGEVSRRVWVDGAALSLDGKRAAVSGRTAGSESWLRTQEVQTGKELSTFAGVRDRARCLAWSPDGKFVAAGHCGDSRGSCPGTLRLWDADSGKEIKSFKGHTAPIRRVAFCPDGKILLSSGTDHTVRLWDIKSGKERGRITGSRGKAAFVDAAFTPDGKRVLTCGSRFDPRLRLWDVATGEQLYESAPVAKGFSRVAALPDGRRCVTVGPDGAVRLWRWKK
jgi:WD40 repeat protein